MKIAIYGKKVGTSAVYLGNKYTGVTLVKIYPAKVSAVKSSERHGYDAIQVLTGENVKDAKVNKPQLSVLKKNNLPIQKKMFEIRLPSNFIKNINVAIGTDVLSFDSISSIVGKQIDAQGTTQGKGYAGAMKRWGFSGLEASHGVSISHRSPGSTGNRQDPGRVFKNKKMAGHMGRDKITVKNLKILDFIKEDGILVISGSIPGSVNSDVFIKDASNFKSNCSYDIINGINLKKAN